MNRRNFFAGLFGVAAAAVMPKTQAAPDESNCERAASQLRILADESRRRIYQAFENQSEFIRKCSKPRAQTISAMPKITDEMFSGGLLPEGKGWMYPD
jgi:hypothetical protein